MTAPETGTRLEAALRSRQARWAGLVAGLVALVLLGAALARQLDRGEALLEGAGAGSLALSLAGFLAFHAGAIASLHLLGGGPRVWSAAQLAKYLPSPGSALMGMVHSAVVRGGTARAAVGLTLRHSAVLLAGALLVGSASVGDAVSDRWGLPVWLAPAVLVAGAAVLAVAGTRGAGLEAAARALAAGWAVAAWAVLGVALWAGVAGREGELLTVAAAFAAAWAVGFLALPVPAGIGVREAVLLVLLEPSLGSSGALSFALLTRVLHIVSDGLVALAFLGTPLLARAVPRRGRRSP